MRKKLLAVALSSVMAMSLFACGGASDDNGTTTTQGETKKENDTTKETTTEGTTEDTTEETTTESAEVVPPTPELADPEALPETPFAHITFDGDADEGYKAIAQVDLAADTQNTGATFDLADKADATLTYEEGPVGKCLFIDGTFGLDLGLKATNTDTYTISFWMNADRLADFGATLQLGYDIGKSDQVDTNNVTWMNVTQTTFADGGTTKTFPIIWSRNEASNAADGTACWPWMYAFDMSIHGKREWVMITIVCSGEQQASPVGTTTAGAQLYLNGMKVYDSADNFTNHTYWAEYTWDASLAPNIMKPGDKTFESYFGINYWDTVFKGYVDDLYVYDTALTPGQVASLYALGNANCTTGVK